MYYPKFSLFYEFFTANQRTEINLKNWELMLTMNINPFPSSIISICHVDCRFGCFITREEKRHIQRAKENDRKILATMPLMTSCHPLPMLARAPAGHKSARNVKEATKPAQRMVKKARKHTSNERAGRKQETKQTTISSYVEVRQIRGCGWVVTPMLTTKDRIITSSIWWQFN